MHHIGYTSRAVGKSSTAALGALCEQPEAHNQAIGVTGLLVFDGVRYIQLIEGEVSAVRQLMARCLIPRFDGAILSLEWKEAVWGKYVMRAPQPGTP